MHLSNHYPEQYAFHLPWQAKLEPAPPLRISMATKGPVHKELPSPAASVESLVYYTPLSVGEKIDASFRKYGWFSPKSPPESQIPRPDHDFLSDGAEENPWDKAASNGNSTDRLQTMDPQLLVELEHLKLGEGRAGRYLDASEW